MGCYTLSIGEQWLTFRRITVPSFLGTDSPRPWQLFTSRHGVTSQKIWIFSNTAPRTVNVTKLKSSVDITDHHTVFATAPNPHQASNPSAFEVMFQLLSNPKFHCHSPETSVTTILRPVKSQKSADLNSVSKCYNCSHLALPTHQPV